MGELKKMLWEFFRQNKALFLFSSIFIFIVPIHDIVLPLIYSKVVDALSKGRGFVKPLILVTSILVVLQVLDFLSDYNDTRLLPKLQSFVRTKTMMALLNKYEDAIEELEVGAINTKLVKLPGTITSLFERCKNFMIPHMLLHATAISLFFYADKYLGLSLMVTVVIMYFVISKAPTKCDAITMKRDSAFNELHEEIDDDLRNLFSIYGTNQKHQEIKRIEKYNDNYNKLYRKTTLCSFGLRSMISPVVITFIIVMMMRVNYIIKKKMVKLSLFIPIFFITLYIINSFMALDDQLKHIIFDWGIVKSGLDLLKPLPKKPKSSKINNTNTQQDISSGIGLQHVSFQYPNSSTKILNDVTLHINHGEAVAVVGDIGSGKSTILKMLLGYYRPNSGVVYYNGKSYDEMSLKEVRQRIGYVPQVPVLFNRTIYENITYGNQKVTRDEVKQVLEEVGLLQEFNKHKHGLDTKVGKNGSMLSGGQRQLVWCLRVMLSNPEVLILDEPTSSIDEKSKLSLRKLLERFMKGKTVIMVTHDPAIVSFAKKFIIVEQGRIVDIKNKP